jgi:hypothetical protein
MKHRPLLSATCLSVALSLLFGAVILDAQRGAKPSAQSGQAEARDMALVGYSDLQGRSAYQPVIHRQGPRWIAYVGHHGGTALNPLNGQMEPNGTSIIDVTEPGRPRYLAHIPGETGQGEAGGAQMVRLCNGTDLPGADRGRVYLLRTLGNSAHEVWDVTEVTRPTKVTTVVSGLHGTHKSWWECDTGIAYLVSGAPGWRANRMTQIFDMKDPSKPVFIRDFGLPGQQAGASGPMPTDLHGPISLPKNNRVYFGYGSGTGGVIQIVDRQKLLTGPKEPTTENLQYPVIGRLDLPPELGAHTAFPVLGVELPEFKKDKLGYIRDFMVITPESVANECQEARHFILIADITTESKPFGISNWILPEASGNFCGKGGRFGAHSSHESFTPIYYKRIMFFAYFNAGVRALDIRDPFNPREIAYYIPAVTEKTDQRCVGRGADATCKVAIQTNNVEVDDRGFIFIVDRANTGMHILELTGAARKAASFP